MRAEIKYLILYEWCSMLCKFFKEQTYLESLQQFWWNLTVMIQSSLFLKNWFRTLLGRGGGAVKQIHIFSGSRTKYNTASPLISVHYHQLRALVRATADQFWRETLYICTTSSRTPLRQSPNTAVLKQNNYKNTWAILKEIHDEQLLTFYQKEVFMIQS